MERTNSACEGYSRAKNYSEYHRKRYPRPRPRRNVPWGVRWELRRTPFMWYYYTPYGYGGYPYGVYS